MRLTHTTSAQDTVLEACENFGGEAAACAEIAQELDSKLSDAIDKIEDLQQQLDSISS